MCERYGRGDAWHVKRTTRSPLQLEPRLGEGKTDEGTDEFGYKKGGACMPLFPCLTMGNYEWPGKEIRFWAVDTKEPLKVLERRKDHQKLCSRQRTPGSGTERMEE